MASGGNDRDAGASYMMVLGFPEYERPARNLAAVIGVPYQTVETHRFPDGESRVRLPTPLPAHTIFCRSLNNPNDKLIEIVLAAKTARELGVSYVTLVAPYLCYMRQDAAFRAGEAISQRIIGRMLADAFDEVVTVDPHLHRTDNLSEVVPASRAVAVASAREIGAFLVTSLASPVVVGPDAESHQWVRRIAEPNGLDYVIGSKVRRGDRRVSLTLPEGRFADREVVIVDDVASTGNTLVATAKAISRQRPATLSVVVTHALFVNDAAARIRASGVEHIWSTDTILHDTNVIPTAEPIAAVLKTNVESQRH